MPGMYAHYRMGMEVKNDVGKREKEIIEKYQELYFIGLHGPDLLFYYKPVTADPVNRVGYRLHDKPGRYFFTRAAQVIESHPNKEAYLAYAYGFICHFALDVTCHGYINKKVGEKTASHTEIESEFDRELLVRDGKNPVRQKMAEHIAASPENAEIIQEFFPEITAKQALKALKGMVFYNNLLTAPSPIKRGLIYAVLKISGNYEKMQGLIINYKRSERCVETTKKLTTLYGRAEKLAVELIGEYGRFLMGETRLSAIYYRTFDAEMPEGEGEEEREAVRKNASDAGQKKQARKKRRRRAV